jgi:hypothetical protein
VPRTLIGESAGKKDTEGVERRPRIEVAEDAADRSKDHCHNRDANSAERRAGDGGHGDKNESAEHAEKSADKRTARPKPNGRRFLVFRVHETISAARKEKLMVE